MNKGRVCQIQYSLVNMEEGEEKAHRGIVRLDPEDSDFSLVSPKLNLKGITLLFSGFSGLDELNVKMMDDRGTVPFRLTRAVQRDNEEKWTMEPLIPTHGRIRLWGRLQITGADSVLENWDGKREKIIGLEDYFREQSLQRTEEKGSDTEVLERQLQKTRQEAEQWKTLYEQITQGRFWRYTRFVRNAFSILRGTLSPTKRVPTEERKEKVVARVRDVSAHRGYQILFLFQDMNPSKKNDAMLDFSQYCCRLNEVELSCVQRDAYPVVPKEQVCMFIDMHETRDFYHLVVINTVASVIHCTKWIEKEIPILLWFEDFPNVYSSVIQRALPYHRLEFMTCAYAQETAGMILHNLRPEYELSYVPYVFTTEGLWNVPEDKTMKSEAHGDHREQRPEVLRSVDEGKEVNHNDSYGIEQAQKVWNRFLMTCIRKFHTGENDLDSECRLYELAGLEDRDHVSVIIPTYKPGKRIKQLLDILEGQKEAKPEVILVDSGSESWELEIMRSHSSQLIQISPEDFSHSYARNLGAEAAHGDILLFMTQDAIPPHSGWIRNMIQPVLKEGICAVTPREVCPPDTDVYYQILSEMHMTSLGIQNGQDRTVERIISLQPDDLQSRCGLNDVAAVVRKDVFFRFRYRYDYGEDIDLGLRMLKAGYPIRFLGSETVLHGHNRNAMYYLRRALLDRRTVRQQIIHEKSGNSRIEEIRKAVACYGWAVYSVDDTGGKNGQRWLDQVIKFFQRSSRREIIWNDSWMTKMIDQEFGVFLSQLPQEKKEKDEMPGIIRKLTRFLNIQVRSFMSREGWEKPIVLHQITEKHFASLLGSEIACLPDEEFSDEWAALSTGI